MLSNSDDPNMVLDRIDGVLLTGGLDVDPAFYSEAPHERTKAQSRDAHPAQARHAAVPADEQQPPATRRVPQEVPK